MVSIFLPIWTGANKVEYVLPLVIWPEFRTGQYRDDHRVDELNFSLIPPVDLVI